MKITEAEEAFSIVRGHAEVIACACQTYHEINAPDLVKRAKRMLDILSTLAQQTGGA
jgi:hypothetical protein